MVSGFENSEHIEHPPVTTLPSALNTLLSPSFISIASDSPHNITLKDISLGLSGRLTTESLFSPSVVSWSPPSPKTVVSYDHCDIDHSTNQQYRYLTPILADSSAEAALKEYSKTLNCDTGQLFFPSPFILFSSVLYPSFRASLSLIHYSRSE